MELKCRTENEIWEALDECVRNVWLTRSWAASGRGYLEGDVCEGAPCREELQRILEQFCEEGSLNQYDDFEWGKLNGRLETLRWVLGLEWSLFNT